MASNKRPLPLSGPEPPPKKQRPTLEDVQAADQDMERRFQKMLSDLNTKTLLERTMQNREQSPFFRLPGEIRNRIYDFVFTGQTQRIGMANRKAFHLQPALTKPLAPLCVCRQLHHEVRDLLYTKSTFAFATSNFVSLFDTWRVAIDWDPNPLLDCLESLPAPWIEKFEVVGVKAGYSGLEKMSNYKVLGYKKAVDYKAKLIEYIHMVYPEAEITFRTVDDYGSFWTA